MNLLDRIDRRLADTRARINPLDFEDCATSMLASIHPGLVPVTGGTDHGRDAEVGTSDGVVGVVITSSRTWDRARSSLRGSLDSMRRHGLETKHVIVANLAEVNRTRRIKLQAIADEFDCELLQVYDRVWFAEQFRTNPEWRTKVLGIAGRPFSLSRGPRGARPDERQLPTVGREAEIARAESAPGDVVVWGVPGVGKSHVAARLDGALFLEDPVDPRQLLDDLISAAPGLVVVDDAAGRLRDLRTLLRVRAAENLPFRVVATCWPHEKDDVSDVLVDACEVEVDLLTREDMGKLLRQRGITRVAVLARILDQARGRPAWALGLADLLIRHGDWQSVWSGDALRAQVLTVLRRLDARDDAREVLGCLAITGRIHEDQARQLAGLLQLRYPEFARLLRSVSIAGLVDVQYHPNRGAGESTPQQTFEVAPRDVATGLAAEVFFSGFPSPVRLQDLKDGMPELAARVVQHQVYAKLVGAPSAVVPPEAEVLDVLSGSRGRFDREELLRTYALVGRPQAAFVSQYLVSQIEDACGAGDPAVAVGQAKVLAARVMEGFDGRSAGGLSQLLGVLEELASRGWDVCAVVDTVVDEVRGPMSGDLPDVDELARLLEMIGQQFAEHMSDAVWVAIACAALEPVFDDNYMSPEVHRQVVLRSFAWPSEDMARLFEAIQPELARRTAGLNQSHAGDLVDLMGKWVQLAGGRGLPFGGRVSAEQQHQSEQISLSLAHELARAVRSPGLRAKFNEVAKRVGVHLDEPDPLFASLIVERGAFRSRGEARAESARRSEEALSAALKPYLEQPPSVLMDWFAEHRVDLATVRNGTGPAWIMRHIAGLADTKAHEWLDAAATAQMAGFAAAFMERCLEEGSLTEAMADKLMDEQESRSSFIAVVLAERTEHDDSRLLESVVAQLTTEDIAMLDASFALHDIGERTRRALFTHPDPRVRSSAAAVWVADHAYDDGDLPEGTEWVDALSELVLPTDVVKDHTQSQALKALASAAPVVYADLLVKHAEQVDRQSRVDFESWEESAQQLSGEQRHDVWRRVMRTPRARELFWVLAGSDPIWVRQAVDDADFPFTADALASAMRYQINPRFSLETLATALRPLSWKPDDIVWTLDVGTLVGEDHERYARHLETSRALAASDEPDLARLGARGVEIYEVRLAEATREARQAAVRGGF